MKKLKLFLISCVALLGSCTEGMKDVEINEKNFPDDNFRAWVLNQEYGKDSVLTAEEIAGIDSIEVWAEEIQSLQGIEFFTALNALNCAGNQLNALDVSKNIELGTLLCIGNKLSTLDLSKNAALTNLDCQANQITELNVSMNTALKVLYCDYNPLTALDLSKNSALTELFCNECQLTALDVSKNSALTHLECSDNPLNVLDVSMNTALTDLSCFDCQLTALDVSKNTELTELWCCDNQLTVLDLSKNTALKILNCWGNSIKDTAMDALIDSLPIVSCGEMNVIGNLNFVDELNKEGNEMTTKQVAAAKAKGWTPYFRDVHVSKDGLGNVWFGYGGIDEEGGIHLNYNVTAPKNTQPNQ